MMNGTVSVRGFTYFPFTFVRPQEPRVSLVIHYMKTLLGTNTYSKTDK